MREFDGDDLGVWSEFGTAAGIAAVEAAPSRQGLGDAPQSGGAADDPGDVHTGFGDAPDLDGLPPVIGLGDSPPGARLGEAVGDTAGQTRAAAPPADYHNRVDADGDGHLDQATYRGDGHGGAEILVDLDHDGHTDFIGHDTDLDNRVDFADYDKNHDGVFEKRMIDDDNDGLLDRAFWIHDS
jgi:hypothetical protein